jgi:hypothetical protein
MRRILAGILSLLLLYRVLFPDILLAESGWQGDSWLTNKGAYTGDLNDSTSTKIADVVDGLITAVVY